MENLQESNGNNSAEYPLQTNNTFLLEPTLESELKKLLENKNKSRDLKLDKISFISKNIQSIGNDVPLIFCNITSMNARDAEAFRGLGGRGVQLDERLAAVVGQHLDLEIAGDKITIGRSHKNQIILEDKMVSSFHAVIKCDKNAGKLVIKNLSKHAGTLALVHPDDKFLELGNKPIFFQANKSFIEANVTSLEDCIENDKPIKNILKKDKI